MTRRACRALAGSLAVLVLGGCAGSAPRTAPHPLAERIVQPQALMSMTRDDLHGRIWNAEVVFLGERHDSQRHHEIQLLILKELVARGRRPAVGFEAIDTGQTALIMEYVAGTGAEAERSLRRGLGWDARGDRRWRWYGPLLEFAREAELAVFGADLPRSLRRRIARVGRGGLGPAERRLLPEAPPASPAYAALMRERFREAVGRPLGDAYLDRLLENWVLRNETMARAIAAALDDGAGKPVVLVAGGGHMRHGRGVPARLARLKPAAVQVNLGLRELTPGAVELRDYVQPTVHGGTRFGPDHPILWLTAPQVR